MYIFNLEISLPQMFPPKNTHQAPITYTYEIEIKRLNVSSCVRSYYLVVSVAQKLSVPSALEIHTLTHGHLLSFNSNASHQMHF